MKPRSAGVRLTTALTGVALCAAVVLAADSHSISFNENVDFSAIKTFAIREGLVHSQKPELNNRLFRQRLDDAIRQTLTAKGLKETSDSPDLFVSFSLAGRDYNTVERQPGMRMRSSVRGMPAVVIPGSGPQPELFTEGTLVLDMTTDQAGLTLIWRGTYRDEERSGPTLSRKLSQDAARLLSEFPPKKK